MSFCISRRWKQGKGSQEGHVVIVCHSEAEGRRISSQGKGSQESGIEGSLLCSMSQYDFVVNRLALGIQDRQPLAGAGTVHPHHHL
jgi:hypothetical protein